MIPDDIRFDETSSPPQFTDGQDLIIEQGKYVRVKIRGIRLEGANMTAIATINEVCFILFFWAVS
jgi:DNA-directed RNA polymerase II subunit RPB7